MAIIASKARPTWAGVVVSDSGGERLVRWLDGLSARFVTIHGQNRPIRLGSRSGHILANAHRRRAVRNALRSGFAVRWRDPYLTSSASEGFELALSITMLLALGLQGIWMGIVFIPRMWTESQSGTPTGVIASMGCVIALFTLGPILASVLGIRIALRSYQTRILSVEVRRDCLTLCRRDGTLSVSASDVRSLTRAFVSREILTVAGERVPLGLVPEPIFASWLGRHAPEQVERHEKSEARALRRAAVLMLVGLTLCVLLTWWLAQFHPQVNPTGRTGILQSLFAVPIIPALMWWASTRGRSVKPRAALADGSR